MIESAAEYTFFPSAPRIFSRPDHTLGHKLSLDKLEKTEIISSIFSDHNTMRLEINYRKKKICKNTNTWRLNNMLENNQWVHEEIQEEIKNIWRET